MHMIHFFSTPEEPIFYVIHINVPLVEFRPITLIEMNLYENQWCCQENVPLAVEKP